MAETRDETAELDRLLQAHISASEAISAALDAEDERPPKLRDYNSAAVKAAKAPEVEALTGLLAWKPVTLAGAGRRLQYLFLHREGPWRGVYLDEAEVEMLINSMLEG